MNARIMWADIKGKVNDVNLKSGCRGVALDLSLRDNTGAFDDDTNIFVDPFLSMVEKATVHSGKRLTINLLDGTESECEI